MPPSKCVSDRQNSRPWGNASMSVRMLAPVVVYPDIISKKASVNEGMEPCKINGMSETAETSIQPKTAITMPS